MMWFHGIGWSWAGCIHEFPLMVVLWGTVLTAIILAVRFLTRQRSDPLALGDTGSIRIEYVLAEDSDQWHRRIM